MSSSANPSPLYPRQPVYKKLLHESMVFISLPVNSLPAWQSSFASWQYIDARAQSGGLMICRLRQATMA